MPSDSSQQHTSHGGAFRTSESAEHGFSASQVRGSGVDHPFHGVTTVELDLSSVLNRCRSFEPLLLAGQHFSHVTALALLGAPIPRRDDSRIHISVVHPRTPPRGRGVIGHSVRTLSASMVHGLPIADAASAWCQSAALLSREDLVAAGDFLITGSRVYRPGGASTRGRALVTRSELEAAAGQHRGSPGARRIAWAQPRVREGVDARPETPVRLLLVQAGLPEPVTDHPVMVEGDIILHADLAYPDVRLVFDYEGDGHRTRRRNWLRDIERRELFQAAGQTHVRVTSMDLYEKPDVFIARVRRHRAAARESLDSTSHS